MPNFKPIKSARIPIISGITAPPIIPETNIPEKAPWFFEVEFKAREIIIDHIVDIKIQSTEMKLEKLLMTQKLLIKEK